MKSVARLLRRSKDSALEFAVRRAINKKLGRIGEMTHLDIDTKKRSIRVRLELAGDKEPVEVAIGSYSIEGKGISASLIVEAATASRKWLDVVLQEFVVGRKLPLPAKVAQIIELLT